MIANTIDAAPRRPAQEITRYCPIGGFDGASSKPTAAGRATNVKNNAIAIAGSTIDGICEGNARSPSKKNRSICIMPVKRIKEANQRFSGSSAPLISKDNTGQIHA